LKKVRIDESIVAQVDAIWKWSRKGDSGFVDVVVVLGKRERGRKRWLFMHLVQKR
jgi:hypothetical protein